MSSQKNINRIIKESYIAAIKNSVGSNMFRNFYAEVDGNKEDILRDGDLSCAFYVSSLLTIFGLTDCIHGTVDGTIFDMDRSGWHKISEPKIGSVLVWEAKKTNTGKHRHIGFYIGNNKAISNSKTLRTPAEHHWTYGSKNGKPERKITAIYWHPNIEH